MSSLIQQQRRRFHEYLLENNILTIDQYGVVSNADKGNKLSRETALGIANRLKAQTSITRLAGQSSGSKFEHACARFIQNTFPEFQHLRPGEWTISQIGNVKNLAIASYQQYAHLLDLETLKQNNPELATTLGSDYTITPDVVVVRNLLRDEQINYNEQLVDDQHATLASIRADYKSLPLLHASVSCKWTIRSDRAQNARSEALNLVRNRKGRLPHVVVVTGEPLPSRLASLALGTGDIDCVYHFALYELRETLEESAREDALDQLNMMTAGDRLKDISDLPLDLTV